MGNGLTTNTTHPTEVKEATLAHGFHLTNFFHSSQSSHFQYIESKLVWLRMTGLPVGPEDQCEAGL